jgi:hypothetical protein
MEWLIAYLFCALVVPAIIGAFIVNDCSYDLDFKQPSDLFVALVVCLLWPITAVVFSWVKARKLYKASKSQHIEDVHNVMKNFRGYGQHDRSALIAADESELKLLIKAYRKNQVAVDPWLIEALREELMRRNMERTLLK